MAPTDHSIGAPAQRQRRSRKSIAHLPSPENPPTIADKENITTDFSSFTTLNTSRAPAGRAPKKSRSKSIGPGGLIEATGNRAKSAAPVGVKSILLPTIPLSPLQEIPLHASIRKAQKDKSSDAPAANPARQGEGHSSLYSDISAVFQHDGPSKASALVSGLANLQNPFAPTMRANETKITIKTEEEQQAAVREREEKEKRELEKNEILQRRDARRKSLANRRVSFAPEATLHTWDVVEYIQDSTTSSASTNSTRRASAMSTASGTTQSPALSSDPAEPPSTPPDQVEEPDSLPSPAPQRQLHQKKRRRRSSVIPPMNFNNPEEEGEFSSSPFSGSSVAGSDDTGNHTFLTANEDNSSASGTESADEGGSTIMSLDEGDTTTHSSISGRSSGGSSTGSTRRLEDALRLAAQQAGTQGIEYDENGDLSMEFANEEITAAFQPWVKKFSSTAKDLQDLTLLQDQESQSPFSSSRRANAAHMSTTNPENKLNEDEEMSMDITRAVGGILNAQNLRKAAPTTKRRKSVAPTRRRSNVGRRRSSGDSSFMGDETMDFTMAIGGIQGETQLGEARDTINEDEDMTMELTSVIGSVLPPGSEVVKRRRSSAGRQLLQEARRRESLVSLDEDMDVTMAIGQILPPTAEEERDHETTMDLTTAVGGILPTGNRSAAKVIMEREIDLEEITSSPFQAEVPPSSPPKPAIGAQAATAAPATGSPSLPSNKANTVARKSLGGRPSVTPRTGTRKRASISGTPTTPSKQLTPQPPKPATPAKTPTPKSVTFRSMSPKKLFKEELKLAASTPRSTPLNSLFTQDSKTGTLTPSVILTPRPRRSSGLGIDKEGLGSPRVTALLDRRRSIGEDARAFVPSLGEGAASAVRFEDPHAMELELEKERQEEEKHKNERMARHNEANEENDATLNLKEMINSLTPKKKVNGRKSLAVGAAKGLLGKRPAELDDEEDESDGSAKRIKVGKELSPVKSVKLRPPPSKVETTGRITRRSLTGISPSNTPTSGSPAKNDAPSMTPKRQGGSQDADDQPSSVKHAPISAELVALNDDSQLEEEVEKIHLQDFLNLTSIRFMELNTTKRRYTVALNNRLEGSGRKPQPLADGSSPNNDDARRDLETCVVAGACTIPMLELYQHSCHELKKYISEGRRIVREIESDTYEENPPLFREYISAPPDVKYIMDNQFKNVKTHARLLSKATWYDWRMGLLSGLQEGLDKAKRDMSVDEAALRRQEDLLAPMLPALVEKNKELESQYTQLQAQADELANCDQAELQLARDELKAVEAEIQAKEMKLEEIKKAIFGKDEKIKAVKDGVEEYKREIAEAERLREEFRGWSSAEVGALKANVDALEKEYGWTISAVSGSTLTMTYRRDIQLAFDVSSFLPNDSSRPAMKLESSPIELLYIADRRDFNAQQLSAPKNFVLINLRALLDGLQQSATKVKDLLVLVSDAWNKANTIEEDARILNLHYPTEAVISGNNRETLLVKSTLLLPSRTTKVEVVFNVAFRLEGGFNHLMVVEPKSRVVYGEQLDERKMSEFLTGKIVGTVHAGKQGGWGTAVRGLSERLAGKGKKA
ncbi:hypothetical protein FGG08_005408 [Glutinoglossum americanum]|uniref:Spc7 kinetochore protein domain-containing protein n=1 Tax=Glutinoglossum americanum TaxID=1670608 RepID=A0A9P8HYH9_9PEZI|nr:hypothetical protein FGG08_005408 [Glutinoglossum americanum]